MKIGVISLGCDKNRVDSEKMLFRLSEKGHTFTSDENEAEVIVINTCGFIESAKTEAIDEILNALEYKSKNGAKVIVTGCLSQRYQNELASSLPEVDMFFGTGDYDMLCDYLDNGKADEKEVFKCRDKFVSGRVLTTPYHYAYLKIADGCSNKCTYCAIPNIRGAYRSEKIEDLTSEAKKLADDGVKELILVAQDTTRYGIDLYGEKRLIALLDELSKLDFKIIRLMYLEPEMLDDELIDYIASNEKIAKYCDVPLQHISDRLLKMMNRHTTKASTLELIEKLKRRSIKIRSSFIVGFPTETEEDFKELYRFIETSKLDFAGFFEYSAEEGTPAEKIKDKVKPSVIARRCRALKKLQEKVLAEKCKSYVGQTLNVVYDGIDYDRQCFYGRTSFQMPDIDNLVYFESSVPLSVGEFYDVEITDTDSIDLIGRVK